MRFTVRWASHISDITVVTIRWENPFASQIRQLREYVNWVLEHMSNKAWAEPLKSYVEEGDPVGTGWLFYGGKVSNHWTSGVHHFWTPQIAKLVWFDVRGDFPQGSHHSLGNKERSDGQMQCKELVVRK